MSGELGFGIVGATGGATLHCVEREGCEAGGSRGGAQLEGEALVRWEGIAPRIDAAGSMPQDAGAGGSPAGIGTLGHTRIVQDFVAAIRAGRKPLVDGSEGRRSLELVLKIYEAAGLAGGRR